MTHRENDAETFEAEEAEEREPQHLDKPGLVDIDEEWEDLIEESITDER